MARKNLAVLLLGVNGSIGVTLTTGVFGIVRGHLPSLGLVTELSLFRALNLLSLDQFQFFGWDLRTESHYTRALELRHLPRQLVETVKNDLLNVKVMPAPGVGVSDHVRKMARCNGRPPGTRLEALHEIRAAIDTIRNRPDIFGMVIVNIASTEPIQEEHPVYRTIEKFERGLEENNPAITSGMLYAYAAISAGVPYVNFTPSTTADIPALMDLSLVNRVVTAGKDGKTGQTLYKSTLAEMFSWRNLRIQGWYSTNILGNDDGYVLNEKAHLQAKEASKTQGLSHILGYSDMDHQVHIDFYRPRGDAKEAWDVVDFQGWLGAPMTMRINWCGQDSVLAAPLVADLVRLVWFAQERHEFGPAVHLAPFFKVPINGTSHGFAEQMEALIGYCNATAQPGKEVARAAHPSPS